MASALPLHSLGVVRTKGGRGDKEPAYRVPERLCRGYLLCTGIVVVMCGSLGVLLAESSDARDALAPAWAAAIRARRAAEHLGHFRATRLGQELERHLEHDMAEKEWALLARARMTRLEQAWRDGVAESAAAARGAGECDGAVSDLREDLLRKTDALWSELRQTLSLLDQLVARGEAAEDQHDSVQAQILAELKRDGEEHQSFADHVEQHGDAAKYADLDDAARKELLDADAWRRDLVDRFLENYDRFLAENPSLALKAPSPLYDRVEKLYAAVEGAADADDKALAKTGLTWRDAEATLKRLEPELAAAGAPAYEPNAPSADDALDYVQIHNVLSYVADLKWRAKLTSSKAELESARRGYKHGDVTPMAFVEQLEDMEARGVFPSDWLYSSGIDDLEFADVV